MNYKVKMLSFIKESKDNIPLLYEDEDELYIKAAQKAHDLVYSIMELRFQNELRQYNNNEERAYDEFIARKNLEYLRVYIEEFMLLNIDESEIEFYRLVRKHMRYLLNDLYLLVNGKLE